MATAKKTSAKNQANQMSVWEEELQKRALVSTQTAESASSGSKMVKIQASQFVVDDNPVGNTLSVIVLGFVLENAYYKDSYDPDNIVPPDCFAFGDNAKTMGPVPEDVLDPKSELCKTCPLGGDNAWGTADKGKGKACKNIRKLLIMTEDDLDDLDEAELRTIKIPVTSASAWDGYVRTLGVAGKPPLAVLTRITATPDPKTQFRLSFKCEGEVDQDLIGAIIEKADASISVLSTPYAAREPAAPARGARGARAGKATATAPAPARKAPRR